MIEKLFTPEAFAFFEQYRKRYFLRIFVALFIILFLYPLMSNGNHRLEGALTVAIVLEIYTVDMFTSRSIPPASYMVKKMRELPIHSTEVTKHFLILNGSMLVFFLYMLVFKAESFRKDYFITLDMVKELAII